MLPKTLTIQELKNTLKPLLFLDNFLWHLHLYWIVYINIEAVPIIKPLLINKYLVILNTEAQINEIKTKTYLSKTLK